MIITRFQNRNVSLVLERARKIPERIEGAIETGMKRGLVMVVSISQLEFLQGPRPLRLGERSTRLRQSMTWKVDREKGKVRGHVGTNVAYGAFHEFGFRGIEKVRAHTRTIATLNGAGERVDNRRLVKDRAGNIVGFKESRKRAAGRLQEGVVFVQFVRAHDRKVDYRGRPFVRPALEKGLPMVIEQIEKEIAEAQRQPQ
jgi:hypothetical protein